MGGLLLYVNEDIPSKFLKIRSNCKITSSCVEINSKERKWFINGSYNTSKSFIANHLECLNRKNNCIIDECSNSVVLLSLLILNIFHALSYRFYC